MRFAVFPHNLRRIVGGAIVHDENFDIPLLRLGKAQQRVKRGAKATTLVVGGNHDTVGQKSSVRLCRLTTLLEHTEEFRDEFLVPEADLRLMAHCNCGLAVAKRWLVGTGRAQCIVDVYHLQDAWE